MSIEDIFMENYNIDHHPSTNVGSSEEYLEELNTSLFMKRSHP